MSQLNLFSLISMTISLLFFGPNFISGQDQQTELGARQKMIERKMVELENRFMVIADKLKDQEPEKYKRLIDTYQKAKESLITSKMAKVTKFLDSGKYDEAEVELEAVISGLQETA